MAMAVLVRMLLLRTALNALAIRAGVLVTVGVMRRLTVHLCGGVLCMTGLIVVIVLVCMPMVVGVSMVVTFYCACRCCVRRALNVLWHWRCCVVVFGQHFDVACSNAP